MEANFQNSDGDIAQLVERHNGIVKVRGSTPLVSTTGQTPVLPGRPENLRGRCNTELYPVTLRSDLLPIITLIKALNDQAPKSN